MQHTISTRCHDKAIRYHHRSFQAIKKIKLIRYAPKAIIIENKKNRRQMGCGLLKKRALLEKVSKPAKPRATFGRDQQSV
jgi:hypothetical protein